MKSKTSGVLFLILVSVLALSTIAQAQTVDVRGNYTYNRTDVEDALNYGDLIGLQVLEIKVNEDVVENGDEIRTSIQRDQEIDIRMKLYSLENVSNVEIEAFMSGYDFNDDDSERISDSTEPFDCESGVIYTKSLSLKLPDKLERDSYKLRIIVSDRYSSSKVYNYNLKIDVPRHSLKIKDVIFSPEEEVKAGRALLSTVRVKNMGELDEDSVKVKVSIPELGISASDYIDEIESDETATSEELYLRIPNCAEEGDYTAIVTAEYNEGYSSDEQKFVIQVVQSDSCDADTDATTPSTPVTPSQPESPKTIITIGPETQEVKQGEGGSIYPVTITNAGSAAKTYTVSVDGADDWANVRVTPSNVAVLAPGDSQAIYVYVAAKETAAQGSHMFTVTVKSGSETLKQIPLTANVVQAEQKQEWNSVKRGLEIGLIVLVVLLIIIGLIIGFSKLKSGDDEDEPEAQEMAGQTYY